MSRTEKAISQELYMKDSTYFGSLLEVFLLKKAAECRYLKHIQ